MDDRDLLLDTAQASTPKPDVELIEAPSWDELTRPINEGNSARKQRSGYVWRDPPLP